MSQRTIIRCDICKKKMEKGTLQVNLRAGTSDPETTIVGGVQIDVCETCFVKLGFTRETAARPQIEQLLYDIISDEVGDQISNSH